MKRWMMFFGGLLLVGSILWPWLREMGLAGLPGDLTVDWQGTKFHLPIATTALVTVVLALVWRLLDRPD